MPATQHSTAFDVVLLPKPSGHSWQCALPEDPEQPALQPCHQSKLEVLDEVLPSVRERRASFQALEAQNSLPLHVCTAKTRPPKGRPPKKWPPSAASTGHAATPTSSTAVSNTVMVVIGHPIDEEAAAHATTNSEPSRASQPDAVTAAPAGPIVDPTPETSDVLDDPEFVPGRQWMPRTGCYAGNPVRDTTCGATPSGKPPRSSTDRGKKASKVSLGPRSRSASSGTVSLSRAGSAASSRASSRSGSPVHLRRPGSPTQRGSHIDAIQETIRAQQTWMTAQLETMDM